jgi:hypothetical protein
MRAPLTPNALLAKRYRRAGFLRRGLNSLLYGALIGVGLLLTVAAGPLYAYTERAAVSLTERTPYVDAVLPDGERGQGVSDDVADDETADEAAERAADGTDE